jgi:hypothetical protein
MVWLAHVLGNLGRSRGTQAMSPTRTGLGQASAQGDGSVTSPSTLPGLAEEPSKDVVTKARDCHPNFHVIGPVDRLYEGRARGREGRELSCKLNINSNHSSVRSQFLLVPLSSLILITLSLTLSRRSRAPSRTCHECGPVSSTL